MPSETVPANQRPVVLSGIQPSGRLTIGNYLGAIRNWLPLNEQFDTHYMLVDLHSISVRQAPAERLERCYEFIALYLACGLDPDRNTLFVQSHVPGHAQLAWVLNCYTQFGELSRMTQFKDKAGRHADNVNAGLFCYPVLMAADILLYGAQKVPVGDDQRQHLELARTIAQRFNREHGETFVVPETMTPPVGARIMGLQGPEAKMSKSEDAETNAVYLLDEPKRVERKIKRAVTDMDGAIRFDPENKPGVSNLMSILAACSGDSFDTIQRDYDGGGYGAFKQAVADAVIATLEPIQQRYAELRDEEAALRAVLGAGAAKAHLHAEATMKRVHDALGFIPA